MTSATNLVAAYFAMKTSRFAYCHFLVSVLSKMSEPSSLRSNLTIDLAKNAAVHWILIISEYFQCFSTLVAIEPLQMCPGEVEGAGADQFPQDTIYLAKPWFLYFVIAEVATLGCC